MEDILHLLVDQLIHGLGRLEPLIQAVKDMCLALHMDSQLTVIELDMWHLLIQQQHVVDQLIKVIDMSLTVVTKPLTGKVIVQGEFARKAGCQSVKIQQP